MAIGADPTKVRVGWVNVLKLVSLQPADSMVHGKPHLACCETCTPLKTVTVTPNLCATESKGPENTLYYKVAKRQRLETAEKCS